MMKYNRIPTAFILFGGVLVTMVLAVKIGQRAYHFVAVGAQNTSSQLRVQFWDPNNDRLIPVTTGDTDADVYKDITHIIVEPSINGTSFRDIGRFPNLRKVEFRNTPPVDYRELFRLAKLDQVHFEYVRQLDLTSISKMSHITTLSVDGTEIINVSAIGSLKNLTVLRLYGCKVGDVSFVRNLHKLSKLSLIGTDVTDITPIGACADLEMLYLTGSRVNDVSALLACSNLKELRITQWNRGLDLEDQLNELRRVLPEVKIQVHLQRNPEN